MESKQVEIEEKRSRVEARLVIVWLMLDKRYEVAKPT